LTRAYWKYGLVSLGIQHARATRTRVNEIPEQYARELQDPALKQQYDNVQQTLDPKVRQQKLELLEQQLQQTKAARETIEGLQNQHGDLISNNPQLKAELDLVQNTTDPKLRQQRAEVLAERVAEFNKPVSVNGEVTGAYDWGAPGPLPDNMAVTFKGARYREVVLADDTILYRAGENDKPLGQFFSKDRPVGEVQTRVDKAVLPEWPGGGKSPIESGYGIKIPKGTKVYVGEVASQGGIYGGGVRSSHPPPWWHHHTQQLQRAPHMISNSSRHRCTSLLIQAPSNRCLELDA
jgi:hypothetical protein